MDAAGALNGYLGSLKCQKKILQDIRISSETKGILGQEIDYIECDAGSIPLPDKTLDLISCHHSFEHFQNQADTAFVKEAQRLLKVGGKCCIVPLFFAKRYAEITDKISFRLKFDKFSLRIIDPTATIPGRAFSGNYARVYDLLSFQRRILQYIDLSRFKISIYELRLDGELLPDLSQQYHKLLTAVEFPHRAMVIEKFAA
jgi:ubiquinone/menaquinone biosynthesis C-methylase UbiE